MISLSNRQQMSVGLVLFILMVLTRASSLRFGLPASETRWQRLATALAAVRR